MIYNANAMNRVKVSSKKHNKGGLFINYKPLPVRPKELKPMPLMVSGSNYEYNPLWSKRTK